MRWRTRDLWKVGIVFAGIQLFLVLMTWVPVSAAGAHQGVLEPATLDTVTVQAASAEDATVVALNKESLQHENDWWWNNGATILTSLISTFTLGAAGMFTVVRYFNDRRDTREKQEAELKRIAEERKVEREKRAEERFQSVVEGLGSEREEAKVGAAITLRTFLREGYEQFYIQTFDLAVAHLRLPRTAHRSEDRDAALPLTTLNQALIVVFKEVFSLARSQNKGRPQSLDATGIQLDNAYLRGADLKQLWMPEASASKTDLLGAHLDAAFLNDTNFCEACLNFTHLHQAFLNRANLRGALIIGADLSEAKFGGTNFMGARLDRANLNGANLSQANLSQANLSQAILNRTNIEDAQSLKDTNLHGVTGLTKEQLALCKAKGAIIDEDPATSASQPSVAPVPPERSPDGQTSSSSSAQGTISS